MGWKKGLAKCIIIAIFFVSVYADNLDSSGYPFFETSSFQDRPPVEIGFYPDTGWKLENGTLVRNDTEAIPEEDKMTQQLDPDEVVEKEKNLFETSILVLFVALTGIIVVIVVIARCLV